MYEVLVFSYTFMPVNYDGFTKQPKNVTCFGQYKILSENVVVIEGLFIY
jgi:hypothetical protein